MTVLADHYFSPSLLIDGQNRVGVLHYATSTTCLLTYLSPFAMYQALPGSDYYGDSVPLRLAPVRESRVPFTVDVQDGLGASFVSLPPL